MSVKINSRINENTATRLKAFALAHGCEGRGSIEHVLTTLLDQVENQPEKVRRVRQKSAQYNTIHDTVQRLMQANEAAKAAEQDNQKRYLAKSLIKNLCTVSTVTAMRYWKDHQADIDEHNRRMGFDSPEKGRHHNQWVFGRGTEEKGA